MEFASWKQPEYTKCVLGEGCIVVERVHDVCYRGVYL